MLRKEHEQRCEKILGKPYPEVHKWIDQYFKEFGTGAHWLILHHKLGIDLGVSKFGEETRKAFELHIKDDMYAGVVYETPQLVFERACPMNVTQAELKKASEIITNIFGKGIF